MKKRNRQYWRNIIRVGLGALLVGILFTFYLVLPILYAQGISQPKRAEICCVTPADWGMYSDDVSFQTRDGIMLRGWYIPSKNRAAIIVAHGIGGNRMDHLEQAVYLAENGFGVLLLDLRAHGDSEGDRVNFAGTDVVAALDYLQTRADVDPQRIGALGTSLGGLVVTQAAAVRQDIRVVVADGIAANTLWDFPRPPTLWHWLDLPFQAVTYLVLEFKGVPVPLSTVDVVGMISPRPLLLISGAESEYERATLRKFYDAADDPKILWEVPDARHAESWYKNPEEYQERTISLFKQTLLAGQ